MAGEGASRGSNCTEVAGKQRGDDASHGRHVLVGSAAGRPRSGLECATRNSPHDFLHDRLGGLGSWRIVVMSGWPTSAESRTDGDSWKKFRDRSGVGVRGVRAAIKPALLRSGTNPRAGVSQADKRLGSLD